MPTTRNLGLAVSSNQNDSVLEYWNKMLNTSNGNFVIIDDQFGILATKIAFTIPSTSWILEDNGPFKAKAEVTISNTVIADNSTVEAYFEDIVTSAGVVLYSVTQVNTNLQLVFYADSEKSSDIIGVLKYVY